MKGLPLPYREPTLATSMANRIAPHIYALDTILLTALVYVLIRRGARLALALAHWPRKTTRAPVVTGSIALLVMVTPQALDFSMGDWFPVARLTGDYTPRHTDYRPLFLVDTKRDGECADD